MFGGVPPRGDAERGIAYGAGSKSLTPTPLSSNRESNVPSVQPTDYVRLFHQDSVGPLISILILSRRLFGNGWPGSALWT